jgi:hypothetical protein
MIFKINKSKGIYLCNSMNEKLYTMELNEGTISYQPSKVTPNIF